MAKPIRAQDCIGGGGSRVVHSVTGSKNTLPTLEMPKAKAAEPIQAGDRTSSGGSRRRKSRASVARPSCARLCSDREGPK